MKRVQGVALVAMAVVFLGWMLHSAMGAFKPATLNAEQPTNAAYTQLQQLSAQQANVVRR